MAFKGRDLAELRKGKKITQVDFARFLKVANWKLRDLEREKDPDPEKVEHYILKLHEFHKEKQEA